MEVVVLTWLALAVALADTWGPISDGFLSPPRDDVPADGVAVVVTNFAPDVVLDVGGVTEVLAAEVVTGVGAPARAAVHPPDGGWPVGEPFVLRLLGYQDDDPSTELALQAVADPSGPPPAVILLSSEVGTWSEETTYPWGCCTPTRDLVIEVEVPDGTDPWAGVEVVGRFELGRPSQITTAPVHTHLALELGAGTHTLTILQWEDNDLPQPVCVDVHGRSASGALGEPIEVCTDVDGVDPAEESVPCGCHTATSGLLGALPVDGLRRRRR